MKLKGRSTTYIVIILCLCSCVETGLFIGGTTVGVGAYRYVSGLLERDYPIDFQNAWDISHRALMNLSIGITSTVEQRIKGKIIAVRKDGTPVDIFIEEKSNQISTVGIRVGRLGSKVDAERIHDEIKAMMEKEKT